MISYPLTDRIKTVESNKSNESILLDANLHTNGQHEALYAPEPPWGHVVRAYVTRSVHEHVLERLLTPKP